MSKTVSRNNDAHPGFFMVLQMSTLVSATTFGTCSHRMKIGQALQLGVTDNGYYDTIRQPGMKEEGFLQVTRRQEVYKAASDSNKDSISQGFNCLVVSR